MLDYILRQEPFGGILYDISQDKTYVTWQEINECYLPQPEDFFACSQNDVKLPKDYFQNKSGKTVLLGSKNPSISAPLTLFLEVTKRCNLRCNHCFNSSGVNTYVDLTFPEICNIIDQISEMGVCCVKITGGEPFIRSDIIDILDYLESKRLNFIVFSNGIALNKDHIEELKKYSCLLKIRISIDGNKDTNDQIRGVGTYDNALRCLNDLCNCHIPCELNYTITKTNYNQIVEIAQKLEQEQIDCKINIGMVKIAGRAKCEDEEYYFNTENIDTAIKSIKRQLASNDTIDRFYLLQPIYYKLFGQTFGCPAGRLTATIKYNGDVFACGLFSDYDNFNCGNVLAVKLAAIWNSNKMNQIRTLPERAECISCVEYKQRCTGACRGNALNYFGDICESDINCAVYKTDFNTLQEII